MLRDPVRVLPDILYPPEGVLIIFKWRVGGKENKGLGLPRLIMGIEDVHRTYF